MTAVRSEPVRVSRRIEAPAADIFGVLADPRRHLEIDGSGMLRGAATQTLISGVGDVFVMQMYFAPLGHYEMNNHVVSYEPDRLIGWEPAPGSTYPGGPDQPRWGHRWSFELTPDGPDATIVTEVYDCSRAPEQQQVNMSGGKVWAESMAGTLDRLAAAVAGPPEPDTA